MEPNKNNQTSMKQQLNTVTPFSKLLALALFIAMPFVGFWIGRHYPVPSTPVTEEIIVDETEEEAVTTGDTEESEASEVDTTSPTSQSASAPVPTPTPSTPTGPTEMTVYITEITLDDVSVDNIAIYEGNAAVQQMIADGLCTAAEPKKCTLTSGQYYRNTDPTVYTYPLLDGVVVQTWTGADYPLSRMVNSAPTKKPYTITISNGYVIKIKEVFQP